VSAQPLPHETDANQRRASEPAASAWVSANAGTGKTEVLVKRVLRLLLAGAAPERILCLTYTKNAAAEMENRLLKELAGWATMAAAALGERLEALTGTSLQERDLETARRLFAQTLEAKGGLKIHTIHGFCERLLQHFPLEAGVTPHFTVLDGRASLLLRREAFDATIARATGGCALGAALATIITRTGEDYFRSVIDVVLAKRDTLSRMVALHDSAVDWAAAECASLQRLLGIDAEETEETLVDALATVMDDSALDAAIAALAQYGGSNHDMNTEAGLRAARTSLGDGRVAGLKRALLTGDGKPRAKLCSKAVIQAAPAIVEALGLAKDQFAEINLKLTYLRAAEVSSALLLFADAIFSDYEWRKRGLAALDYEDLIVKAKNLLSRAGAASWVLYKMDRGIDHILVDEAQDTNPEQWAIIQYLAEEFFAGIGASERVRTLFAVGDEKQSIYSFQGAEPARFAAAGIAFRRKAQAADLIWHDVPLTLSFRSTPPILRAVDAVFARPEAAQGLTWQETASIEHHAYRQGQAGIVELWELEADTPREPALAFEPWNEDASSARGVDRLCQRIASTIKGWIDRGDELKAEGREVRPGDILILVRRRDPFTTPMIRALKRAGVSVAGADRMRLMQQLAIQDLVALADFLLMPEDDLALAVVLKSPLFGFDDNDLFALAHGRPSSLWAALKARAAADTRFAEAVSRLGLWLSRADFVPPYEFFAELLGEKNQEMRKRLLTRLGPEAAEAIEEFLDLALAYDREAAPSLQGFIELIRAGDVEVKRDMEQDRDEVRIMTVHAAKGLQAPIVFLPDTSQLPQLQGPRLFALPRQGSPPDEVGHLVWPLVGQSHETLDDAKNLVRQAETEEYHRLLYVAMTRARDRLYICGWLGQRGRGKGCWYDLIKDGLDDLLGKPQIVDGKSVRRLESKQEIQVDKTVAREGQAMAPPLPDWALAPARIERSRRELQPSRLAAGLQDGDILKAIDAEQPPLGPRALAKDTRFSRGRLVHALLQYLPEVQAEDREGAAKAFVAARGGQLPETIRAEIVAETLAIVSEPDFQALFATTSLAEVPIVARIGEGDDAYALSGQIDRLAVLDEQLLILDYKTNRPPPATPEEVSQAYINQLAAYRIALRKLFPGRSVKAALLWTDGPKFMEIPSTLLDGAERRMLRPSASLDAGGSRT
jgi:ATP-dependent helicase/nuclease subunit A